MTVNGAAQSVAPFFTLSYSQMTFAVYSKFQNQVRVHYSHLTESQAQGEVDRMNDHCSERGFPAIYWCEEHHPESIFVIN